MTATWKDHADRAAELLDAADHMNQEGIEIEAVLAMTTRAAVHVALASVLKGAKEGDRATPQKPLTDGPWS